MYSVPAFSLNNPVQPAYRLAGTGAVENEKPISPAETDTFMPGSPSESASGATPPPNTPAEPNGVPLSRPAFPANRPFPMSPPNPMMPLPVQSGFFWPGGSAVPLPNTTPAQDSWNPMSAQNTVTKAFPSPNEAAGLKTLSATRQMTGKTPIPDTQNPNKDSNAPLPTDSQTTETERPKTKAAKGQATETVANAEKSSAKEARQSKADKNKRSSKFQTQDSKPDKPATLPAGEVPVEGKSSSARNADGSLEPETALEATPEEKPVSIFSRFVEARQTPPETKKPDSKSKKRDSEASSKMVAAYKILFAVCGVGFMNAFLFGSPLLVSIGLALGFAGAQSYLALKVAKEDNWISKGMMAMSRWLTGSQNDKSQSGKERAMAPVWALVSSGLALIEAGMNIGGKAMAAKFASVGKWGFKERSIDTVLAGLVEKQKTQSGGVINLQVKSVRLLKGLSENIQGFQRNLLAHVKDEAAATGWAKARNRLIKFVAHESSQNARGLLWAGVSGFVGGYVLSILAAKVHENFEKRFQSDPPPVSSNATA